MAKVKVSIGLLAASLALLIIYGADVAVVASSPDQAGILPQEFDDAMRGMVLGGGAVIMSIAAFVIARKEPSGVVTALLFANGGLIIAGMLAVIGQGDLEAENAEGVMRTVASTMAMGALLVGLGGWKAVIDRKVANKKEQTQR